MIDLRKNIKVLTESIWGHNDINTICAVAILNESATHFFIVFLNPIMEASEHCNFHENLLKFTYHILNTLIHYVLNYVPPLLVPCRE